MGIKTSNKRGVGFVLTMCGLIGVVLVLIVNLVALLVMGKSQALFFTSDWWALWFQNYVIWAVIAGAGLAVWLISTNRD